MKYLRGYKLFEKSSIPYELDVRDILSDLSDDGLTYTYIEGSDIIPGLWVDIHKGGKLQDRFRWIDVKHQVEHLISFFKEIGYGYDMNVTFEPINYDLNSKFIDDLNEIMDWTYLLNVRLRFDKAREWRDVAFSNFKKY